MPLQLDENPAAFQIRAFKPGFLQVNDKVLTRSIIVSPQELIEDWPPQSIQELTHEALLQAVNLKPEILLIGTGEILEFPPIEIYGDFINQGIGIEVMNTLAACRTYNALTAEHRRIVAALIIK